MWNARKTVAEYLKRGKTTAMHGLKKDEQVLNNCKFLKTILMLLVILGHACSFWTGSWFTENPLLQSQGLSLISTWIGSFHIYAFALVSGYIFVYKIRTGGYSRYLPFLQNKAKRLLVPYAFAMLIWVAPISEYFFRWDWMYLIKKYIFCINPSQLWFLWMLFGVFVIVWPLRRVMIDKPLAGWAIAIALYGLGVVGGKAVPNVFCIWTACQYITFFFIGMRIRVKSEKQERLITETVPWYGWIIADVVLFVGTTFAERQKGFVWSVTTVGMSFLLHIVGAIMAWTVLQALAVHIHWQESRVFKTLATYSMPMYLFHQQIIYFSIAAFNGIINPWLHAGVNFVMAIVGSFIISAFLMRWKVTRFLVGEKA